MIKITTVDPMNRNQLFELISSVSHQQSCSSSESEDETFDNNLHLR
jgi:hypothetical protein